MPGAFAYHLHSFSAATIRDANSHWVGPLLARGATISMGCVYEPFLQFTPDVGLFAARLIFDHFTFGEAAYSCQNCLSWQTTVVGDPLYRPFGTPPSVLHDRLLEEKSSLADWSDLQIVNLGINKHLPLIGAEQFLEQTDATQHSPILSEKLADLCDELGKPSSAVALYEQALNLKPSRQQTIRLRMKLGDKLVADGRDAGAYDDYRKLIEEWPDYPGKVSVYEKLEMLAGKMGRNDEAAKWRSQINLLTAPAAPATTTTPPAVTNPEPEAPRLKSDKPPIGPVGIPRFAPPGPVGPTNR
jgi:tetratricopeptide (TPR) repeat protein